MADRGAGRPTFDLSNPYAINVVYGDARLRLDPMNGAGWFGPLQPMAPTAPREVEGRQWDFPAGWNLQTRPRSNEPITFADLRGLADGYDLLRTVIESRKDQMQRFAWNVKFRDASANRKPGAAQSPRILKAETFFRKPDGQHSWNEWLGMLLEDLFVIDAPTLWVERSRAGELLYLHPMDGATIKRVIDDWGRTPRPFEGDDGEMIFPIAFQQVLKGFPAVDYTSKELIYRPRNIRVHKAYGYSPVEQIIMTVNIALRRQVFHLQYFTEGSVPDMLIGVPDAWTPDQIKQFQDWWDALLSGNTAERRHAKFIPGGMQVKQTKEDDLKGVFDEWLARVVCFAFRVSPLPFINVANRSTSDNHKEQSDEEGLSPTKMWVKNLVDDILVEELDSPDLEFTWGDDEQIEPKDEKDILTAFAEDGIYTLNQVRAKLGEDPHVDPNADKPILKTAKGWMLLENVGQEDEPDTSDATGADDQLQQPPSKMSDDAARTKAA